jgi:hypothetical protein
MKIVGEKVLSEYDVSLRILSNPTDWPIIVVSSISIIAVIVSSLINYKSIKIATSIATLAEREKMLFDSVRECISYIISMEHNDLSNKKFIDKISLMKILLNSRQTSAQSIRRSLDTSSIVTPEDFETWKENILQLLDSHFDEVYQGAEINGY